MAKFNQSAQNERRTPNFAGGAAYNMTDKAKIITQVLTSFFKEEKFYGDNSFDLVETAKRIMDDDAFFIANLAVYAREVFYMRSAAHVLAVELANHPIGRQFARNTIARVAQRPDDMTEMLAYQLKVYGKPIPNSLKKGLADAFATFDEYQLAKYNRTRQAVKLKDVFRLVNPSAKKGTERYELYRRLLENNLPTPYTWETELSARGNQKEVWEELIDSGKVGYMALLRNVRNIVHAGASNIHKVYDILRDPDEVKRSKLLPFQFFSAYRVAQTELQQAGSALLDALNDAIETSVANIPALPGKTFMTADMSASMTWTYVSEKSSVHCGHIAALMMAMAHKICEQSITSVFADSFKVVNVSTRSGILDNMNVFLRQDVGSSTHLYKAVEWLLENQIKVDRIIVFSDMQAYGGDVQRLMERYRKEANRDVWVHSFDLSGYGTQLFAGKNINLMSGWSDKALQFIRLAEEGADSLVKTIESYR